MLTKKEWLALALVSGILIFLVLTQLDSDIQLEAFGFISGVVCAYLVIRQHVFNFLAGIVNSLIFFVMFYRDRLFGYAGIQVLSILLCIYGIWQWTKGGNQNPLKITSISWRIFAVYLASILPLSLICWFVLAKANGSSPFWDGLSTATCFVAQYMLSKKILEGAFVWVLANSIYVILYLQRGFYLIAALSFLFVIMSFIGWREWRKAM